MFDITTLAATDTSTVELVGGRMPASGHAERHCGPCGLEVPDNACEGVSGPCVVFCGLPVAGVSGVVPPVDGPILQSHVVGVHAAEQALGGGEVEGVQVERRRWFAVTPDGGVAAGGAGQDGAVSAEVECR